MATFVWTQKVCVLCLDVPYSRERILLIAVEIMDKSIRIIKIQLPHVA